MASKLTQQEIKKYREFIKKHPIDPKWDKEYEMLDSKMPREQFTSRVLYEHLKELGELGDLEEK